MAATRDELISRLKRAGELELSGEDQAETDSYFNTSQFRFHGPDGFEADYLGLANYFKAIREAFDERSIRRGIIVAEGDYIACQTWMTDSVYHRDARFTLPRACEVDRSSFSRHPSQLTIA
jgi:hypothetical protein